MHRLLVSLLALVLCLFSTSAVAAIVDLYGLRTVAGQEYYDAASYFSFKVCVAGSQSNCYFGQLDNYGHFYPVSLSSAGWYDIYMWRDYIHWGSNTQPIGGGPFYVPSVFTSISVTVPPQPLEPQLVEPCNWCHVWPGDFYLKWTDGLDSERRSPTWPVTYDIWASETPVGWPQQPERLVIPDAPCNPDAYGHCQWYVDALVPESGRSYTWRIVVKMNVGAGIIYSTSGPSWHLSQY